MEAIDYLLAHQVRAAKYYNVNRLFEILPHLHTLLENRKQIVEKINVGDDCDAIKELLKMNEVNSGIFCHTIIVTRAE